MSTEKPNFKEPEEPKDKISDSAEGAVIKNKPRLSGKLRKKIIPIALIGVAAVSGGLAVKQYQDWKEQKSYEQVEPGSDLTDEKYQELGEGDPTKACEYFKFYKNKPYAKEVLKTAAAEAPVTVLENFSYYSGAPYAEEVVKIAVGELKDMESNILLLTKGGSVYERYSWGPAILEEAAKKVVNGDDYGKDSILEVAGIIKKYPWGAEMIKKVAPLRPIAVLFYSDKFCLEPYAKDLIAEAALKNSLSAMGNFSKYEKMPGSREILRGAIEKILTTKDKYGYLSAENILENSQALNGLPDRKEIIERVVRLCLENKRYYPILKSARLFEKEPWAEEVISEVLDKENPAAIIVEFSNIKNMPNAKNTLLKALDAQVDKFPLIVIESMKNFADIPEAGPFIEKAVRNLVEQGSGNRVMEYFKIIKEKPYVEDIMRKIAEKEPALILAHFEYFKEKAFANSVLQTAVEKLLISDPRYVLSNFSAFENQPYTQKVLEAAAQADPKNFLAFSIYYRQKPYAKEIIKKIMPLSARLYPKESLQAMDNFPDGHWDPDLIDIAARSEPETAINVIDPKSPLFRQVLEIVVWSDPVSAIQNFYRYDNEPYAKDIINTVALKNPGVVLGVSGWLKGLTLKEDVLWAKRILRESAERTATSDPDKVFLFIESFEKESWAMAVVEKAAKTDPSQALDAMNKKNFKLRKFLKGSNDEACKIIMQLYERERHNRKSYFDSETAAVFLHKIVSEKLSFEEAEKLMKDKKIPLRMLMELKAIPDHIGDASIERYLKDLALRDVRHINDLHEQRDAIRFASVKDSTITELYTLMTYGESEIFTSSFNGIFNRMIEKMKKEKISGDQLLKNLGNNKFRIFIRLCAGYNRLNEFLSTMEPKAREDILKQFVSGIEQDQVMLEQAVAIADTFSILEDQNILRIFQEKIKEEYDRVKKQGRKDGEAVYGLLAGMFENKAVINEEWILEMAKKYKLPNPVVLSAEDLFDMNGIHAQRYFFYNDEDGRNSFKSFLAQYQKSSGWKIEEHDAFVVVYSIGGKKIEIYANKPQSEREQSGLDIFIKTRKIQPTVIMHRGHSYHVGKTIEQIPIEAKIISLGSCGGYFNVDKVLERSKGAHFLGTKGTGTMTVNDPLMRMLNEEIKTGKDISWPKFWTKAQDRFGNNPAFKDYIPPHKNLGVLFLKAYKQSLRQGVMSSGQR